MDRTRTKLKDAKRVVVKIGTTTLTHQNGKLNLRRIKELSWVLSDLKNGGKEVILVSSGAIAVGTERLCLPERPRDTRGKQAASAVGQAALIQMYQSFFSDYNQIVAQILLTRDVIECADRRQNARNTFNALISMGVIPIVNENDTVSTDEVELDNDTLSAYVAALVEADALIMLSDIDGLYTADPNVNPGASRISQVDAIDDELWRACTGTTSRLGTGGMATKLTAAGITMPLGIDMVVASGERPAVLHEILNGDEAGTLFAGSAPGGSPGGERP